MSHKRRVWTPRRSFKRRLPRHSPHPIYAESGNEQPLLQDLVDRDAPAGGLAAYLHDLEQTKKEQ